MTPLAVLRRRTSEHALLISLGGVVPGGVNDAPGTTSPETASSKRKNGHHLSLRLSGATKYFGNATEYLDRIYIRPIWNALPAKISSLL